jgi:hypothetical protein
METLKNLKIHCKWSGKQFQLLQISTKKTNSQQELVNKKERHVKIKNSEYAHT